eukprot:649213-Pelagomonas_calceolata.AAC.8
MNMFKPVPACWHASGSLTLMQNNCAAGQGGGHHLLSPNSLSSAGLTSSPPDPVCLLTSNHDDVVVGVLPPNALNSARFEVALCGAGHVQALYRIHTMDREVQKFGEDGSTKMERVEYPHGSLRDMA